MATPSTDESNDSIQSSSSKATPSATPNKDKKRFNLKDELSDIRKLIDHTETSDIKVDSLHKHCMNIVRDYKRLEKRLTECQKKQSEIAQHRDIIQTEHNRTMAAKSKLESLCRELQKRNKEVQEESRVQARDEEEKRREIAEKFQNTIDDITVRMQEHHEKNIALKQENNELMNKLKKIIEQYEAREKQFEELLKQKHLELQLYEAKLAQQVVAIAEIKESNLVERQYLLAETMQKQKRCEELAIQEVELKGQLSLYSGKFEEFQSTLNKSNEVFSSFKKEMEKMSKTIAELEKESQMWKSKYEKCNRSLLEMADEHIQNTEAIKSLKAKNEKLEKLCRALQTERTQLSQKIKELQPSDTGEITASEDNETTPTEPVPSLT
jgi:chromosome segregation ATPase